MNNLRVPRARTPRSALALSCLAVVLAAAPGVARSQPAAPSSPPGSAPSAAPAPSAAASASAATAGSAAPPDAPAGSVSAAPAAIAAPAPTARPAGPPEPTAEQLETLAELEREAAIYADNARDYRSAITRIVEHHYQERRRRILSSLDVEIATEKKGLREAREEAIRRLEAFVAKYSGVNAHPESTPDAMFRLAALYEERATADTETLEELSAGLLPAIALYKRILSEFPSYRELAGVYYYLGHALNNSNRIPEAQQVWRSLVCHNKYSYPTKTDPKDPTRDLVSPLVQDHDSEYWNGWSNRHPIPIGQASKKGAKALAPADGDNDDITFQTPYPATCEAIAQKVETGVDPRYLAEVWWLIGDYHFNEVDIGAGPYVLNRADAAYSHALKYKQGPVYGVAMYKRAWTLFKQQRYEASVREFVALLRHTDEVEKETGEPGTDFRSEAFTYIAGSLTYDDFVGPGPDEPDIPRTDVLDVYQGAELEAKMHEAIDRVRDPKLIPQDAKWTVDIYKALAKEFLDLKQYHNTIEVSEIILERWPMDRDAPEVQARIADIYDTLTQQSTEGSVERTKNSAKALEARTKLAAYIGKTPWVQANKDDPEALQAAERLVRGGIRRAAADHTNAGSALVQQALSIGDKESRDPVFERALAEYRLAAEGWDGYLAQDDNAPDAYESRYWLADANHAVVAIIVAVGKSPSAAEIAASRDSAVAVRDSNEDDKYLEPAGQMVVDTAYQALLDQYQIYERTSGAQGLERREAIKLVGEGNDVKPVVDPIPAAVLASIQARDEYIRRVPAALDVNKRAQLYGFQSADYYFIYGQFADAKKRFEPIYKEQCGKTEYGYKAWERLTTMSNLQNDVEQSRALAEAALTHSCAVSEEQKVAEGDIAGPTISRGYYVDAAKAYEKAEKMADGPERTKAWREAAALYKVALEKAPARDEAPEAAIYGARAYKQVGEYDKAIAMYELFIKEYGNEANLTKLEKGEPNAKPPKPPEPKHYEERVTNLKDAYDALSSAYVLFFNYRKAAETYDTISRNKRFEKGARRDAARNAVLLYSYLNDGDKMTASRATFLTLDPPPEQRADIDYLMALAALKTWDENGVDEGANRTARLRATAAMDAYFGANRANPAAAKFVVQAAYYSAKLRKAGKDPKAVAWCQSTVSAFNTLKSLSPVKEGVSEALGSFEADMAAECAYNVVDERIKDEFDYDTSHHRYAGVIIDVKKNFDADVKKANDVYYVELKKVIEDFGSRTWSVAAKARQGSLYDSCRTGLYNATPPAVKLYTPEEEKLLKMAEESDRDDLQEKADAIRQQRREQWRAAREQSIDDADKAMIKFYVEAVIFAKAWKIRNPSVDYAIRRLAFFTDIIGDAKMRQYSQSIVDPDKRPFQYTDGVFLKTRPGAAPTLTPSGMPAPLPVVIQ